MSFPSTTTNTLETSAKIHDGKKWKARYCVLQRSGGVGAAAATLYVYKNAKSSRKAGQKKQRVIRFEPCYGIESGFLLDKEAQTLAMVCSTGVTVLAFETDQVLRSWEKWLRSLFRFGYQYSVWVEDAPINLKEITKTYVRLHLQDGRFCLVTGMPARLIVEMRFRDIRRYGAFDNRFYLEAGSRLGQYAGAYVFISSQCDHMAFTFPLAADGRLHRHTSSHEPQPFVTAGSLSENHRGASISDDRNRSLPPNVARCGHRGHPLPVLSNEPSNAHNHSETDDRLSRQVPPPSSTLRDLSLSSEVSAPRLPPHNNVRHAKSADRSDYMIPNHSVGACDSPLLQRVRKSSGRQTSCENSVPLFKRNRVRPNSVCQASMARTSTLRNPTFSGRPLSAIVSSTTNDEDNDDVKKERAALKLSQQLPCCRCRNYVNQGFIESLQYYYNIDQVVLDLSRKSKCCEHDCTAEAWKPPQPSTVTVKRPETRPHRRDLDSSNCVTVSADSYAKMMPVGGLYVRMNSTSPYASTEEIDRRRSLISLPPDDPSQTDEDKAVTVSSISELKSNIVVLPVLAPKNVSSASSSSSSDVLASAANKPTLSRWRMVNCGSDDDEEDDRESSRRSAPPSRVELSSAWSARRQNSMPQRSSNCPTAAGTSEPNEVARSERWSPTSSKGDADMRPTSTLISGGIRRSASFAREVLRSSSRRTKSIFGALIRRASSRISVLGGEHSATSLAGDDDGRESRARSAPPNNTRTMQTQWDYVSHADLERRNSPDLDEVVYEGSSCENGSFVCSNVLRNIGIKPLVGLDQSQTVTSSKKTIFSQRSIGNDSTWSNCSYAEDAYTSNFNTDLNSLLDSVSVGSDNSDSDSVFLCSTNTDTTAAQTKPKPATRQGTENKPTATSPQKARDLLKTRRIGYNESVRRLHDDFSRPCGGSYSRYDGNDASEWQSDRRTCAITDEMSEVHRRQAMSSSTKKVGGWTANYWKRQRREKPTSIYSLPAPQHRAPSPPKEFTDKNSRNGVCFPALRPPYSAFPLLESQVFRFPDVPQQSLNYVTLAEQETTSPLTPNAISSPTFSCGSRSMSAMQLVPADVIVEYAKIDELATQAARKAVSSRREVTSRSSSVHTLSEGEQGGRDRSEPIQSLTPRFRRPFLLKRPLLRRRTSFASLSGV